jgi:hypothetical protein
LRIVYIITIKTIDFITNKQSKKRKKEARKMRKRITTLTVIALFSITLFSGCAMTTLKEGFFEESIEAAEKAEGLKEEAIEVAIVEKAEGLEKEAIEVAIMEKEPPIVKPITEPVDESNRMLKDEGIFSSISFDFDKFSKRIDAKSMLFKVSMLVLFGMICSFGFIIYKKGIESKRR